MSRFHTIWIAVVVVIAIAVVVFIGWSAASAFAAEPACLSHAQAKAKWPSDYLYWRTEHHCWYSGPRHSRMTVKPAIQHVSIARGTDVAEQPGPTIAFPSLMQGSGTSDDMLRADAMTTWPAVMDFDDPPQFEPWQRRVTAAWAR
jgi:hypothetical protein